MEFPILYKKADKGKTKFWKIYIINDPPRALIFVEHGFIGGKITKIPPQIVLPLLTKTALERARQLVETKWNNRKTTQKYMEKLTDEVHFSPMKPVEWEKFSGVMKFPAYLQPKLDGVRMFAYLEDGELKLLSRQLKPIENIGNLKPIISKLEKVFKDNPSVILDGELLIGGGYEQRELRGVLRKKYLDKENDKKLRQITYNVFDMVDKDNMGETFEERWGRVKDFGRRYGLGVVPTYEVRGRGEVGRFFREMIGKGYEGAMIRSRGGVYRMGKMSQDLQKIKLYFEDEFKIVGYHEGTGSERGTVIWEVECLRNPERSFRVRPMGTREEKREMFKEAEKYIGKKMIVQYYEKDKDGCVTRIKTGIMK